jgi:hypothetical protein
MHRRNPVAPIEFLFAGAALRSSATKSRSCPIWETHSICSGVSTALAVLMKNGLPRSQSHSSGEKQFLSKSIWGNRGILPKKHVRLSLKVRSWIRNKGSSST